MNYFPFISVIIPCRNEEKFIEKCLDSIIAQDYPKEEIEILIIDGMSEDGTREIVEEYVNKYPFIRLLDNPKKITPSALNIGIKNAKGEVIMRMDAHALYKNDYISKCIKYQYEYDTDNVGGINLLLAKNNTPFTKAIVECMSCRFGVGNATYRTGSKEPKWVDTVQCGCYKREVFNKIGIFNENLKRSQDIEFNLRLKKAGLRTLLVPDIISYNYVRSDLKSFIKHYFLNGVWAIIPFRYSNIVPVSIRSLVPMFFVLSLICSAILSFFQPLFCWLFLFIVISYTVTNLIASSSIAIRKKDLRLLFLMPLVFTSFHISYGLGSIWGLFKLLVPK